MIVALTLVLLPRLRLRRREAAVLSMFRRATSRFPCPRCGREPSLVLVGPGGDPSASGSGDSSGGSCGFGMLARRSSPQILLSSRLHDDRVDGAGCWGTKHSPSCSTPAVSNVI